MALLGTIVNAVAILVGTFLGAFMSKIPDRMKNTILQGMGLVVFVIGASMAFTAATSKGYDIIYVIGSLVLGGIIGEVINIDGKLESAGKFAEKKLRKVGGGGRVGEAFVFASLVYVIGAMGIVGALQSGLQGEHKILFTKAMIDGFTAIFFTSAMGIGVGLSAIPVFIYEGAIALLAHLLSGVLQQPIINIMSATGGLLIMGIALNVLEIKRINVANLLPSIFVAAVIKWIMMTHFGL